MSESSHAEQIEPKVLDEADITDYLQQHPDFLQRHPEVLQAMELEHNSGGAVSLIERQVDSLRQAKHQAQSQLSGLVEIARDNEQRVGYLNELAKVLIGAQTPADMLDGLRDYLQQQLSVDALFLGLTGRAETTADGIHALQENSGQMQALTNVFRRGQPICGPLADDQVAVLFPDAGATPPRSAALIPLGGQTVRGALVLASRDPQRFVPEMGTLFLELMGDLMTTACRRQLGSKAL